MFAQVFHPAQMTAYNSRQRTATVWIQGLTDGADRGLTAHIAYPFGDCDRDTELQPDIEPVSTGERALSEAVDVWVFFEGGDPSAPVVAFYRGHQDGSALENTRRIRQDNIELLARSRLIVKADQIDLTCQQMTITAPEGLRIAGPVSMDNTLSVQGAIQSQDDVTAGGISLKSHLHSGVRSGGSNTGGPV